MQQLADKEIIKKEPSYLQPDIYSKQMILVMSKSSNTTKSKIKNTNNLQLPANQSSYSRKSISMVAANFIIKSAVREIYKTDTVVCCDNIVMECETNSSKEFSVRISYKDFSRPLIKPLFEEQCSDAIFSVDIDNLKMNRLLFNYIKSIMKSKEIYIAERPGFQFNNGNYRFVFHNENNGEYETDAVKNAKFELADNIDNIESELIKKVFISEYAYSDDLKKTIAEATL